MNHPEPSCLFTINIIPEPTPLKSSTTPHISWLESTTPVTSSFTFWEEKGSEKYYLTRYHVLEAIKQNWEELKILLWHLSVLLREGPRTLQLVCSIVLYHKHNNRTWYSEDFLSQLYKYERRIILFIIPHVLFESGHFLSPVKQVCCCKVLAGGWREERNDDSLQFCFSTFIQG